MERHLLEKGRYYVFLEEGKKGCRVRLELKADGQKARFLTIANKG